jgi:fermentation-respiration switch protein FrsA (DUF1100 family)
VSISRSCKTIVLSRPILQNMITVTPLTFHRGSIRLAGRLYRNTADWTVRQPGVLVTGSWLTVKEQMPDLYARRLAERGYSAFTFDFSGFGESEGEPRQAEMPDRKIGDLMAAADFLSTLSPVEPQSLTHVAICASAQYGLAALARGSRISRFVSVAGWFHDLAGLAGFYGGEAGIAERLDAASRATRTLETTGVVEMVPAYRAGDMSAAMFFELDYYANASRGAVPSWRNEMATLSWTYWFLFDGLRAADQVSVPALFVHSDGCVFPDNLRSVHDRVRGPKQLVWSDGTQTDYYDRPAQVGPAIDAIDAFLKEERP